MEKIPLFLASDEFYAPQVATTILSVMKHTTSFVDFFILSSGISETSKEKIERSISKLKNYSIEFIDIEKSLFDMLPDSEAYVSKATYNRLLIPQIKPELKKVIYSDVDVIFMGDIKLLYDENLDGKVIGAVQDAVYWKHENFNNYVERLNVPIEHKYFYAGLLLIDAEKWREKDITKNILKLGEECFDILKQGDQDLLNMFFACDYKELSPKYEATNGYLIDLKDFDDSVKKELKNIVIRHYESAEKPWNSTTFLGRKMPHQKSFWQYARQTVFFQELKAVYENKLKRKEIVLYIFNILPFIKVKYTEKTVDVFIFSIPFLKVIRKTK